MAADDTITKDTEVSLTGPGGWGAKMRNVDLRTFMLILTLLAAIGAGAIGWHHEVNAQTQKNELATTLKESNKAIADALKEATAAQKERDNTFIQAVKELSTEQKKMTVQITIGNCMNEQAMKGRQDAREVCRRIVRDNQ